MARVQVGPIVSDLRGKVGGNILQRSAHGLTLRALHKPVNPRTPLQATMRADMARLQMAWQQLTDNQRTAWSRWAEFQNLLTGKFIQAAQTGQQTFIQVNRYRLLTGQALLEDPVFTPYSQPIPTLALDNAGANLTATFDGMLDSSLYAPILFLSFPLTPTRNAKPAGVRYLNPVSNVTDTTWTYGQSYIDAFGALPDDNARLWAQFGVQQIDNGALSIFQSTIVVVA